MQGAYAASPASQLRGLATYGSSRCTIAHLRGSAGLAPKEDPQKVLDVATLQAASQRSLHAGLSDSGRRGLALWLGGCAAWVYSMVVLGGLTRLTRSGLSMTDWKFSGERPPLNEARHGILCIGLQCHGML